MSKLSKINGNKYSNESLEYFLSNSTKLILVKINK